MSEEKYYMFNCPECKSAYSVNPNNIAPCELCGNYGLVQISSNCIKQIVERIEKEKEGEMETSETFKAIAAVTDEEDLKNMLLKMEERDITVLQLMNTYLVKKVDYLEKKIHQMEKRIRQIARKEGILLSVEESTLEEVFGRME